MNITPVELRIKAYAREFLEAKMAHSRSQSHPFGAAPAIIIREPELEPFLDALWRHLNERIAADDKAHEGEA